MLIGRQGPHVPQATARALQLTLPSENLPTTRLRMRAGALSSTRSTTGDRAAADVEMPAPFAAA